MDLTQSFSSQWINMTHIAPAMVAVSAMMLIVFLYSFNRHDVFFRGFLLIAVTMIIWLMALIGSTAPFNTFDLEMMYWRFILYMVKAVLPVTLWQYTLYITGYYHKYRKFFPWTYAFAVVVSVAFGWHDLPHGYKWLIIFPELTKVFAIGFIGFIFMCWVFALSTLFICYRRQGESNYKLYYFFNIILIGLVAISYSDLILAVNLLDVSYGYSSFLIFMVGAVCLRFQFYYDQCKHKSDVYQIEAHTKTEELKVALDDLRKVQYHLLEKERFSTTAILSAGLVHQISQPLTTLHGLVKFMKSEWDSKDQHYQSICLMAEQSAYMKQIIEDLSSMMRHRQVQKKPEAINTIIYKSINLIKDQLKTNKIKWTLGLADDLPLLNADQILLQQAILNIVLNAVDTLKRVEEEEKRWIKLETSYRQSDDRIVIKISDGGPGIPDDMLQEIFKPLFSTKRTGMGIGLALSRNLIQMHQGQVSVNCPPNGGTHFYLVLPCIKDSDKSSHLDKR